MKWTAEDVAARSDEAFLAIRASSECKIVVLQSFISKLLELRASSNVMHQGHIIVFSFLFSHLQQ
jgi:hypothetical protein